MVAQEKGMAGTVVWGVGVDRPLPLGKKQSQVTED